MEQFLEKIRTHFNVIHKEDFLSLTLINPNLDLDIINQIKNTFRLQHHIKKQEIVIIESVTFDDQLLQALADALPQSLEELSLDFTGCESLRGTTFPHLFQRLSLMDLKKLKLDLSEVFDVNDTVIEGLSLLLQNLLDLEQFYLDLYQVDQITEDGYLLLAESLTSLQNLKSLHLDFSANPNLTEDSLQLLFMNIIPENLESFEFRILDIDHIGGGSFFKLGETLSKMKKLNNLVLTISTFSNLNHKGIYFILKEITYLQMLNTVNLNFSNIQLPEKIMSYLNLPPSVETFALDISCNSLLTDGDILSLIKNVKHLSKLSFNVDFCQNVTDDSLEQILQIYLKNGKCKQLHLPDKNLSDQLIRLIISHSSQASSFVKFQAAEISQKVKQQWQNYQKALQSKRNTISAGCQTTYQTPIQNQRQETPSE